MRGPGAGGVAVRILAWLFAALATAVLAHALIGWLGDHLLVGIADADAFDKHAHLAVGPVAGIAVALLVAIGLRVSAGALARTEGEDRVTLLAEQFATMRPTVPSALVALGGSAALIGMECLEQCVAFGHIAGIGDALGGNVLVGAAAVALVAVVVTVIGLRCARAFVAAVAVGAVVVATWIAATTAIAALRATVSDAEVRSRRPRRQSVAGSARARAHRFGLRAPPRLAAANS